MEPEWFRTLAFVVALAVLIIWAGVALSRLGKQVDRFRFRQTFGVWPEDPKPIVQKLVDWEISKRAGPFLGACLKEQGVTQKLFEDFPSAIGKATSQQLDQLFELLPSVRPFSREVRRLKSPVRSAQDLAKEFGYTLRPRLVAYLPADQWHKYDHLGYIT